MQESHSNKHSNNFDDEIDLRAREGRQAVEGAVSNGAFVSRRGDGVPRWRRAGPPPRGSAL